jgi:hypothetical protein
LEEDVEKCVDGVADVDDGLVVAVVEESCGDFGIVVVVDVVVVVGLDTTAELVEDERRLEAEWDGVDGCDGCDGCDCLDWDFEDLVNDGDNGGDNNDVADNDDDEKDDIGFVRGDADALFAARPKLGLFGVIFAIIVAVLVAD